MRHRGFGRIFLEAHLCGSAISLLVGVGAHVRHASHRSGRDADVLFYTRRDDERSASFDGWLSYGGLGWAYRGRQGFQFDTPRNWHWVRTLLVDEQARVQWLFCSGEIKSALLRYAARNESSAKAISRAAWVLHQPRKGNTHRDHFHLRVACSVRDRQLGCRDGIPKWPWLYDVAEKNLKQARPNLDDESLFELISSRNFSLRNGAHSPISIRTNAATSVALASGPHRSHP